MKNRPKPNKAAYASNGTNFVKKSTETPPLEKNSVPMNMDELAKLQDPKPSAIASATESENIPVKILKKDSNPAKTEDK